MRQRPDRPGASEVRPAAVILDWDETVVSLRRFEREVAVPAITSYLVEVQGVPATLVASWASEYLGTSSMLTGTQREQMAFADCTPDQRSIIHQLLKQPAMATPIPGMPELLAELRSRGVPRGIASNGKKDRLHQNVEETHMAADIDAVVSSEDVGARKPNPASILRTMDLLDVPEAERSSVIYVGNRYHDVIAALAAGVRPWLVGFGTPRSRVPRELQAVLSLPGVEYFASPSALRVRLEEVCSAPPAAPPPAVPGLG